MLTLEMSETRSSREAVGVVRGPESLAAMAARPTPGRVEPVALSTAPGETAVTPASVVRGAAPPQAVATETAVPVGTRTTRARLRVDRASAPERVDQVRRMRAEAVAAAGLAAAAWEKAAEEEPADLSVLVTM